MRNGFGWWRLAKQVVLGAAEAVVSAAQSTFTLNAYVIDVSGTTTLTADGTVRDADGTAMEGVSVSDALAACTIDGAECRVSVSAPEIEDDGVDSCTLTIHVYDTQTGAPVPDIATARFSLSGTTGLTVTPVDSATGVGGSHRWTITSTTPDDYTIGGTVDGVSITDTASLTVSGVPLGTWTPDFLADWGNSTGTGTTALRDGTVFDGLSPDSDENGEVIAAPGGYGWNTTNVLQHNSLNSGRGGWLEVYRNTLGEQAEGEVRNFRWAHVNVHPTAAEGATDNSHHCVQDGYPSGSGSNQNWNLTDGTNFTGEWEPNFLIANGGGGRYYLDSSVSPTRLDKDTRYTFEVQIIRGTTGAGTSNAFRFRAWVYDSAGVELYGPADWRSGTYSGETLATDRWHTFNNLPGTQQFNIGCNGTSASSYPLSVGYFGEVALVTSDSDAGLTAGTSIGAYGSCTGE